MVRRDVGVYALVNWRAGLIYVGSSRTLSQRRSLWRSRLLSMELDIWPDGVFRRFFEACKGLPASSWEFVVIERFDAAVDREAIRAAEYRYVGCIERLWSPSMLNVVTTVERDFERELERVAGVPYVRGLPYRPEDGHQARARGGLRGRLTGRDRRVLRWLDTWCRFPRARPGRGGFRPYRTPRVKRVLRWLAAWCRF